MNLQVDTPIPSLEEIAKLPVHPMAARFPMWSDERLQQLAADITANGLNIPIVIWREEMMLLDGRNRVAACVIADVQPSIEWFDGDDPRTLIISRNIQTREMSASQKAMLLASEFPDGGTGGRGKKGNPEESAGFSGRLLRDARQIVKWASDLVDGVIVGSIKFDAALKKAGENRQAALSEEARLHRLREGASDLALRYDEDELTLKEAEAIWFERQREQKSIRDAGRTSLSEITAIRNTVLNIRMARELGEPIKLNPDDVATAVDAAHQLQEMLREQEEGPADET